MELALEDLRNKQGTESLLEITPITNKVSGRQKVQDHYLSNESIN